MKERQQPRLDVYDRITVIHSASYRKTASVAPSELGSLSLGTGCLALFGALYIHMDD